MTTLNYARTFKGRETRSVSWPRKITRIWISSSSSKLHKWRESQSSSSIIKKMQRQRSRIWKKRYYPWSNIRKRRTITATGMRPKNSVRSLTCRESSTKLFCRKQTIWRLIRHVLLFSSSLPQVSLSVSNSYNPITKSSDACWQCAPCANASALRSSIARGYKKSGGTLKK